MEANKKFEPISFQSLDADLTRLREVLTKILLAIPNDEENGTPTAKYTTKYGLAFVRPTKPAIYKKTIAEDAKSNVRIRAEEENKAKMANFKVLAAEYFGSQKIILTVVEDMWIHELKDNNTFYAGVTSHQLITHLKYFAGGLHTITNPSLQNKMQTFHLKTEGIPEYINALEDSQKQAKQSNHPINNGTLVLIATNAMLTTKKPPCTNKKWEDLDKAAKYWDKWEAIYKSAEKKAKVKHEAAGGKDQFGAAHRVEQEPSNWWLGKTAPISIK